MHTSTWLQGRQSVEMTVQYFVRAYLYQVSSTVLVSLILFLHMYEYIVLIRISVLYLFQAISRPASSWNPTCANNLPRACLLLKKSSG